MEKIHICTMQRLLNSHASNLDLLELKRLIEIVGEVVNEFPYADLQGELEKAKIFIH